MFLPSYEAYVMTDEYANFISLLVWFRMYCVGEMGETKNDYADGFKSLKDAYDSLYWGDVPPEWIDRDIKKVFEKGQSILSKKRFTKTQIDELGSILYDFENNKESNFRHAYLEYRLLREAKHQYPQELVNAVYDLMEAEQYEAAIFAAFKFLDGHIQKLLDVSPHDFYGESLINAAFAQNTGLLQLKTTSNEQIGIRNFYSGANALFRNPSAHRFIKYDLETAGMAIAMVAMMAEMVTRIHKNRNAGQ
jgi:uncharacterized protein (TIGR02391 family)